MCEKMKITGANFPDTSLNLYICAPMAAFSSSAPARTSASALASETIEDWQIQPAGSTAKVSGRRSDRRSRRRGRGIVKWGGGDSWVGCEKTVVNSYFWRF
ncbi:hypothetical protein KSP39_PZI008834 [Platanthera zijinensis]|uniref:Uncharacterized protein n=1 Tax=Platanthera zijinensis TaxID=2320716 RepID=A0AAP0G872_9ASPA